MKLIALLLLVGMLAGVSCRDDGPRPDGRVTGQVTNARGRPIYGAYVEPHPGSDDDSGKATTADDGLYSWTLPVGDYQLEASRRGYQTVIQTVTICPDKNVTLDFVLPSVGATPLASSHSPPTPQIPILGAGKEQSAC